MTTDRVAFNDQGQGILSILPSFTGSETFTRHGLYPRLLMTEGVMWLSEIAGSYWLTDIIASYQTDAKARREAFQVWNLYVAADGEVLTYPTGGQSPTRTKKVKAVVIMTDGNTKLPIITQFLDFTDFPLSNITMWVENNTLMLPGER